MALPKLFTDSAGGGGGVSYIMYGTKPRVNKKSIRIPKDPASYKVHARMPHGACFSGMCVILNKNKALTRVAYNLVPERLNNKSSLSDKDTLKFLGLCKKNGFLPEYTNITETWDRKVLVLDLEAHSRNLIYIYLSSFRLLETDPKLLKNVLMLTDLDVDFALAMTIATSTGMHNMNHMFLPGKACTYGGFAVVKDITALINIAAGLYALVNELPHVKPVDGKMHHTGFTCNKTIEGTYKADIRLGIKVLLSKKASEAVRSKDVAEYEKLTAKL